MEVGRSDLVAKYVGWTAKTVQEKFKAAIGGVLFIDEAYALADDRGGSFGDESINTIVQEMENRREDLVVIFAGNPEEMERFLDKNPGLRSRIAFHVPLPNQDKGELCANNLAICFRKRHSLHGESMKKTSLRQKKTISTARDCLFLLPLDKNIEMMYIKPKPNKSFALENGGTVMRSKNPEKMNDILKYITDYMIENHEQPTVAVIAAEFHNSTSTIHAYLKEMDEKGMLAYQDGRIELPLDGKIGYQENTAVLLDNNASCGPGSPEEQNIQAYINLPAHLFPERNLVIITAKGDSMEDAGISENDLLFVETAYPPKKGEIVVALDDEGETQVKRLKGFRRSVPILAYENRAKYPDKLCDKRIVAIQGVVRHILKHC